MASLKTLDHCHVAGSLCVVGVVVAFDLGGVSLSASELGSRHLSNDRNCFGIIIILVLLLFRLLRSILPLLLLASLEVETRVTEVERWPTAARASSSTRAWCSCDPTRSPGTPTRAATWPSSTMLDCHIATAFQSRSETIRPSGGASSLESRT